MIGKCVSDLPIGWESIRRRKRSENKKETLPSRKAGCTTLRRQTEFLHTREVGRNVETGIGNRQRLRSILELPGQLVA